MTAENVIDLDSRRTRPIQDAVPAEATPAADTAPSQDRANRQVLVVRIVRHATTRAAARQVMYVGAGTLVAARQRRDARSTARHERMMHAAATVGDHQTALEWEARAAQHRAARHARRMQLLKEGPIHLARSLAVSGLATVGTLLILGVILAATTKDARDVIRPLVDAATFIRVVFEIIGALWWPMVAGSPALLLAWLWSLGRTRAEVPAWLAPAGRTDTSGAPITPSSVVVALRDLGHADLRKRIKEMADGASAMLGPIKIAGCGVEVDVTLPSGVATNEIQNRRRKLAENLGRHEHEVFITIPQAARTVRLWIADSGALDEPIGPSPLALDADPRADFVTGRAPWGQDLRGDLVGILLYQMHLLITGLSNQGKTAALRALALWALLDPCVEMWVADLKGVGDWRMLDGLATVLIQGPTDDHVAAATEMVEKGVAEMERRIGAVERSGSVDGISAEMARKPGSGFHPLVLVVDEAQVAFMCPAKDENGAPYGGKKATSRYFMACRKLQNQGRAVNVTLWQGTQDPTDENLPKLVREGAHIRAALVLGTESQSRMALGEAAVNAGAAPHTLRQGLDKGTLVTKGDGVPLTPGQASVTLRTHYIDGDGAVALADVAKARRKPVETRAESAPVRDLDVLGDVAAVLRHDETLVLASEVILRLIDRNADAYRKWTVNKLSSTLAPFAVIPRKTKNGAMHVDHAEVRAAMAERDGDAEAPGA